MRKTLAIIMMITMVFCYMPLTGFADTEVSTTSVNTSGFIDMPNNWSTEALSKAVGNGLLEGFKEKSGTFIKPSDPLTRAQMATIVNRAFGAKGTANLTGVKDVPQKAWYTAEMQKAVKMGTMKLDSKMRPNDPITRQEAFTVLARAFKMADGTMANLEKFSDKEKVSSWAVSSLGALARVGYIQGADGKLNPLSKITRAEFAVVMDNMIKEYINKAGTVTQVHEGNLMINVPDVILKDITVKGDLILGDGIGEGNVTLENVIVKGNLIARGGGVNSIIIVGGGVDGKIVIAKVDGQVRVSVEGGAEVEVIVIDDGKDDVIIEGTVGTVEVTAPDTPVIVQNATVTNIEIKSVGAANVTVASGSTVTNVVVGTGSTGTTLNVEGRVTNVETSAANTNVGGTGTVTTVTTNEGANNTSVTTPSTKVNNEGASGVTAGGGTEVPSGSTATNSNTGGEATVVTTPTGGGSTGSGSGSGDTVVNVSAISVTTPPTKTKYTAGESLDLTGLVIKITKTDNSTEEVVLADFVAKGITTSPVNGAELATTDTKVTITHTESGKTVEQNITVVESVEPATFAVTIDGDAAVTTDYTVAGADDLNAVETGTTLKITAVTAITVNGEEVAVGATKDVVINKATTITINKQEVEPATFAVTFVAASGAESLDGATITVYSDAERTEVVTDYSAVEAGTYYYTIAKDGFDNFEGSVEITDAAKEVEVTLVEEAPATYAITFAAADEAESLEGATITVYSDAERTEVVTDYSAVEAGTYYYTIAKDGFDNFEGSVEITDAAKEVEVTLVAEVVTPATYAITFVDTNSVDLEEATIEVKSGEEVVSDLTAVADGEYTFTVTLEGYEVFTGSFTVEGAAKEVSITLVEEATQYRLTLTGEGLTSDPEAGLIDEDTEVTITVTPAEGMQVATFTVDGEDKKSDLVDNKYTFTFTKDTTVAVTYEAIPATEFAVTFKDTNDVDITEATIEVKDSSDVVVTDLTKVVNGTYSYTVTLTGYEVLTGSFTVDGADKEVSITLVEEATQYRLTLTGEGLTSDPEAGLIDEDTEVTITVTPAEGMQVATFTVDGEDKKSDLVDNKYTFTFTKDTTVAVTYEAKALEDSRAEFDRLAKEVKEITDGEGNLVAKVSYENYTVTSTVDSLDPAGVSGTGIFAKFAELGVKEVKFADGEWIEVIPANVTKIVEGVEANKEAIDNGFSVSYRARIQPEGHVEFEEDFTAIFQLSDDKIAALAVETLIEALPAVTNLALTDKAQVEAAREAYDALTDNGKALVENFAKLTEAEQDIAKSELEEKVSEKVDFVNGGDYFSITFTDKTSKIKILDPAASLGALTGTGALVALADIEEVRGYKIGDQTRNFYNTEGVRESSGTIKAWLLEDGLKALGLTDSTNLGALVGKSFTAEVIGLDGRVDFTDTYTFEFVEDPVTEAQRDAAKAALATKVAGKVDAVNGGDNFAIGFADKTTTIKISDYDANLSAISGTGALVALADIEEVRGYKIGDQTRNFYNTEGVRESSGTIKAWLLEDGLKALGLTDSTNLGALVGKSFTAEVIGLDGRVDFTDTYTFEFVEDPVTEAQRDAAKAALATKVAGKVDAVNGGDNFAIGFADKTTTIKISDYDANLSAISGTGALVALADIEEVRGYKIGDQTRNFYNTEGVRESSGTIKAWLLEDGLKALGLTDSTNLGALVGKSFTAEVIGLDGRVDFTDTYTFEFVEDPVTEAQRDAAKAALATKVAGKVDAVNGGDNFAIGFADKTTTIKISDYDANLSAISGTGALVALADIEEVRGYTIGDQTRNFYNTEGVRESSGTIKAWLLEDGLKALGLTDSTNLGALVGKSFTAEVIGLDGRVDFTDTYTFEFVEDPVTEAQRDAAKAALATKVAGKVDAVNGGDNFAIGFADKTTTIKISDYDANLSAISGTGALVALADIEEVRGYTIGDQTRNFYNTEGVRESSGTIKAWLLEDGLKALGLTDSTNLGALVGKSFTAEVIGLDGRVDFTDTYTFEFVEDPVTEAQRDAAKAALATKVAGKVDAVNGGDNFAIGFADKTTTIKISDYDANLSAISGTGALVALADIEEVRGYTIGDQTRNFYNTEGVRESSGTIKAWLLVDGLKALGLTDSTNLGALVGKSFTAEVIGLDGRVDFTDTYTFEFVEGAPKKIINQIATLPELSNLTLNDKAAVVEARAAYNVLPEAQKGLVTNLEKLIAAEDKITDIEDILTAKTNIETATYTATQVEVVDAAAALTKAQALVNELDLKGTTATVVAGDFTAAIAGAVGSVDGTDGSYTFTVKINKGGGDEVTTTLQTMVITAIKLSFPYGLTEDSRIIEFGNDEIYPWEYDLTITDKISYYPTNQGVGNSTSSITCTVNGKGILSYDYKVSAEDNWDYLKVYVNENLVKEYKSSTDWTSDYIILLNETQTVKFEYKKDSSGDSREDKVWIANLVLTTGNKELILVSNDEELGSVSESSGTYEVGSKITISAIEKDAETIAFVGWFDNATSEWLLGDGTTRVSSNYTFNLLKDRDIKGIFKRISQIAPTGLIGVAPTSVDDNDGKITGTTVAMEYKLASAEDSAYVACLEDETIDLAVGTYNVRYAAKEGFNAGTPAIVHLIVFPYGISEDSRIAEFVNDSEYPWQCDSAITDKISYYPTNQGVGNSTSSIACTVTGKGILEFDYKLSAEDRYDYLKVYVDNVLVKENKYSIDWTSDYIILLNETQTVKFEYKKDSSGNSREDKVWIANLILKTGNKELKLTSNNVDLGSVSASSGVYEIGTELEISATETDVETIAFVGWFDKTKETWLKGDGTKKIASNYTFNIVEDRDIEGVFKRISLMPTLTLSHDSDEPLVIDDGDVILKEDGVDSNQYIISLGENITESSIQVKKNDQIIQPKADGTFEFDISENSEIEFISSKDGYVTTYLSFDIKTHYNLEGLVEDSSTAKIIATNDLDYPWIIDSSVTNRIAYYPTNQGVHRSTPSITCIVNGKGILSYDYKVSAEDRWDYLKIYVDDELVKEYKEFTEWDSDFIVMSNETQTVKFEYKKDGSGNSREDKVWIANLALSSGEKNLTLNVDGSDHGSISGTYGENDLIVEETNVIAAGTEINLIATAVEGGTFYGWVDESENLLSTSLSYSFTLINDLTIKAVFAQEETYVARKNGVFYSEGSGGLAQALNESISGDIVRLLKNYTLVETVTVPNGVTLMIPYSEDATEATVLGTSSTATGRVSWTNESKYLYLTLTIPESISLNVDGSLIVGAVQHYPNRYYQGNTSGAYSQIICDGEININDGGMLDLYGLLKGDGNITGFNGSVIYQPFMISDYPGGSNTQAMFNLNQTPFNRYGMVNIQTDLTMHYGSTMYGHASLYFWSSITTIDHAFIGEGGLIVLSEGATLTATYDESKHVTGPEAITNLNSDIGKTTLTISGGAKTGFMTFPLGIKTNEVFFSIPYNYDIVLENGNYDIPYAYKLMPGASLWVKEDATLEVTSGLYVYDGLIQSDMSGDYYPTTSMLETYGFNKAAEFVVDGTFIVRSGKTFGGIIQTNGSGKVIFEEGANVVNDTVLDGGKGSYDANTSKFSLAARGYDGEKLVAMEAGQTYNAGSGQNWILPEFTATYAKNSTESDYDEEISKVGSWYHKWITTITTINQSMKGSWQ